jgi:hypothetical protein
MWPDSQNKRGMRELTFEVEVSSLPDVLLAAAAPIEKQVTLLQNGVVMALRLQGEVIDRISPTHPRRSGSWT